VATQAAVGAPPPNLAQLRTEDEREHTSVGAVHERPPVILNQEGFNNYAIRVLSIRQDAVNHDGDEKAAVDVLIKNIDAVHNDGGRTVQPTLGAVSMARRVKLDPRPINVDQFHRKICAINEEARDRVSRASEWLSIGNTAQGRVDDKKADSSGRGKAPQGAGSNATRSEPRTDSKKGDPKIICSGCGHMGALRKDCSKCPGHPDRNNDKVKFSDSKAAEQLRKRGITMTRLDLNARADGTPLTEAQKKTMQIARDNKSKTGESVVAAFATADNGHLFPCSITLNDSQYLTVNALIDTGSLQANYVSSRVAEWLRGQELLSPPMCIVSDVDKVRTNVVNLGGTDMQSSTLGCVSFNLNFTNELSNSTERISCVAAKIFDSKFDLIIGLPLIRASKLAAKIPSFFNVSKGEGAPSDDCAVAIVPKASESCLCNHRDAPSTVTASSETMSGNARVCTDDFDTLARTHSDARVTTQLSTIADVKNKEDLLDYEDDPDDVQWPDDPFELSAETKSADDLLAMINICGSPSLQRKIGAVCREFIDIFSEAVRPEPANVPPMELKVDMAKWQTNRHRLPPRPQTRTKMQEIERQVKKLLDLKVIEPSAAAEHSQVHLVPKPTPGDWRFCLDFVELNDCTEGTEGWPIPNIPHMSNR
jgi:hypothetical protein